jgi:hypothetical protein
MMHSKRKIRTSTIRFFAAALSGVLALIATSVRAAEVRLGDSWRLCCSGRRKCPSPLMVRHGGEKTRKGG